MHTRADLQALLDELDRLEQLEASRLQILDNAAWAAITADPESYEWRATVPKWRFYCSPEGADEVVVECRIKSKVYGAFVASGGMPRASCLNWHGMVYHRTDEGILTHGGGGSCILRDPMLCNDDEWQAVKSGNPAAKYCKPWVKS